MNRKYSVDIPNITKSTLRKTFILFPLLLLVVLSVGPAAAAQQRQPVSRNFVTLPSGLGAEMLAIHDGHFFVGTFSFTAADGTILVLSEDGSITRRFTIPGLPLVSQVAFLGDALFATAANLASGKGLVVRVNLGTGIVSTVASGFYLPKGIAADKDANLFVADIGTGNVSKIAPSGTVSVFASGPLLEPALLSQVNQKLGSDDLAFDRSGDSLYVTNFGQGTVVRIAIKGDGTAGEITKFADVPTPSGLAFDTRGNLYVTSPYSGVWIVSPDGSAHKLNVNTSNEPLSHPSNLALSGRQLYVTCIVLTTGVANISVIRVPYPGSPMKHRPFSEKSVLSDNLQRL